MNYKIIVRSLTTSDLKYLTTHDYISPEGHNFKAFEELVCEELVLREKYAAIDALDLAKAQIKEKRERRIKLSKEALAKAREIKERDRIPSKLVHKTSILLSQDNYEKFTEGRLNMSRTIDQALTEFFNKK